MHFNYLSDYELTSYIRYYMMLMPNDTIAKFLKECEDESKKRGLQENNEHT